MRIILTASSGRCGTYLLARILDIIPGVTAMHEPDPRLDNIWWRLRGDPGLADRWLVKHKIPTIEKCQDPIYIETTHQMCKGFFEPMLANGHKFDLIILSRDLRSVALSMYKLNDIPSRSRTGRRWYPWPSDATNLLALRPGEYKAFSDYQMCYWYVLEMELRKAFYRWLLRRKGAVVVDTSLEQITTARGYRELVIGLGLPVPSGHVRLAWGKLVRQKHNTKGSRKSFLRNRGVVKTLPRDLSAQEDQVREIMDFDNTLNNITKGEEICSISDKC